MASWTIKPLNFGYEECNNGADLLGTIPFLGFYLTDGNHKVLCDNGIQSDYIVDGKSHLGYPAGGGEDYVLTSLDNIQVKPDDIDLVIYTHLHMDHAGNCHLFPKATHMFQDAEWKELVDPLPSMIRMQVFDQNVIPQLKKLKCQRLAGDVELIDGLKLIHTPGHTAGSQCLQVTTKQGDYILAGDLFFFNIIAYPETDEWTLMDGTVTQATQEFKDWIFAVFSAIVFDHYAWYKSQYRIRALLRKPEYLLPGHEPSLLGKTFG
jgi:glyoxylase-like metal-dependent hydrolase (beta-lactamase superfamily II)